MLDRAPETDIDITVTVPLYNEADNIPILYQRISDALNALGRSWELVLVNDGSRDRSGEILDAIAAADARVTVVHFRTNYGQTAAFMAGLDLARGRILVP